MENINFFTPYGIFMALVVKVAAGKLPYGRWTRDFIPESLVKLKIGTNDLNDMRTKYGGFSVG